MPRYCTPIVAAVVAVLAAATPALGTTPSWAPAQVPSAPGAAISALDNPTVNNRIAAAPDGSVLVAWIQSDGSNDRVVARRYSAATGTWTAAAYLSPAGTSAGWVETAMDSDGNATVAWGTSPLSFRASTLLAGGSSWSEPQQIEDPGDNLTGGGVATGPDGTVIAAYLVQGDSALEIRTRARNSASWGAATRVALDAALAPNGPVTIDFNTAGDGALMFFATDSGDDSRHVFMLRFDHATRTWSTEPREVANSPSDFNQMCDIAIAGNNDVAVLYETASMEPFVRIFSADGTATAAHELGTPGALRVVPQLAADASNHFVAAWQPMEFPPLSASIEIASSRTDGSWSEAALLPDGMNAGGPVLAEGAHGSVTLGYATGIDHIATLTVKAADWSATTQTWGPPTVAADGRATSADGFGGGAGSMPRAAIDGQGHTFAMWSDNTTTPYGIGFSVLDRAAPRISELQVPDAATTGEDVGVSVAARDAWSGVASIAWDFGDGTTATGATAHHSYTAAGDYTVGVAVTDGAGNTRTEARTIAIDEPAGGDPGPAASDPAPADTRPAPPTPRPPAPEARLSGRTIKINALVKTPRARCHGSATVAYRLPGRRYTASVTLVRTPDGCRASGTIRLAKTPSARTTLRLTVRGKRIKTRTVVARRA